MDGSGLAEGESVRVQMGVKCDCVRNWEGRGEGGGTLGFSFVWLWTNRMLYMIGGNQGSAGQLVFKFFLLII